MFVSKRFRSMRHSKASIKQAEALQKIAEEKAKQTEYVKTTESLKQQEI